MSLVFYLIGLASISYLVFTAKRQPNRELLIALPESKIGKGIWCLAIVGTILFGIQVYKNIFNKFF